MRRKSRHYRYRGNSAAHDCFLSRYLRRRDGERLVRSTVSHADAFPRWSFLGRDKAIEPGNMTAGARRWWYHLPWRPRAPLRWVARTVVDQGSAEPVKLGDRVAATFELRLHDTIGCQTGCATGLTTGWMFVYTMQPVVQPVNRLYRSNGVYGSGWAQ